ncbi:haloacid dehalogenase-like hydrolase [Leptospira broomii serovar Hurstbridge str. 5399]|uniref:Haloacid dehalogenase-like hydrolase n=2 Tax=Leptospira broomii TaxID=301541 RepID=T0FA60_9LEPT|nr:haloacid dehalogenase-like hydrolase [Leptospira broomii serovar Hurstbridge str. 5399]
MFDTYWSIELSSFLRGIIDRAKPLRVIFDFDNTLVRNDFGEAVMNELLRQGLPWISDIRPFFSEPETADRLENLRKTDPLSFQKEAWAVYDTIHETKGLEVAYRWSTWIFSGRTNTELRKTARAIWEQNQNSETNLAVKPYNALFELILELRRINADIWIVTASPEGVIREVSGHWNVPENRVLGVELATQDGVLSHRVVEPFTYGAGKVQKIMKATNGEGYDISFGDTENDFALLENSKLQGIFLDRGKGKIPPAGSLIQPIGDWSVL